MWSAGSVRRFRSSASAWAINASGPHTAARIVRAGRPMHGKVSQVTHDGLGIFTGLPSPFHATRYHSLVIAPDSLPDALRVTARSEDGEIMAVAHREHPTVGVQFHPESALTEYGYFCSLRSSTDPARTTAPARRCRIAPTAGVRRTTPPQGHARSAVRRRWRPTAGRRTAAGLGRPVMPPARPMPDHVQASAASGTGARAFAGVRPPVRLSNGRSAGSTASPLTRTLRPCRYPTADSRSRMVASRRCVPTAA